MSDPVTNMAIEDVLSSIRRLVSEGDHSGRSEIFAQPGALAVTAPSAPELHNEAQANDNAGKFVLSPAFRVAENRPAVARMMAPLDQSTGPETNPPLSFLRPPLRSAETRSVLELRIAELEAAVTDQAGEWEPDGSEDVPVVDWSLPEVGESLVFASRSMPQPDRRGVLDLGKVGTRIHPVIVEDELEPEPASALDDLDEDLGEDLDLSADAALLNESGIDQIELADDRDDAALLDEAALRKMVVEIVRQELQGPMGERITRNVRKMVRREIYRVLSSQEFES